MLITSVWNVLRVWGALEYWEGIQRYSAWPGPVYVIGTGAVWAIVGMLTLAAFWRRDGRASRLLAIASVGYAAWLWADRLLIMPRLPTNWPFSLALNAAVLATALAVAFDRRNSFYLGKEAHGRSEQDR